MKTGIFITGTDTGVGKTFVSSVLLASLHSQRILSGYWKPIQTGLDWDTPTIARTTGISLSQFPPPTYTFPEPQAPFRAAQMAGQSISLDRVHQSWKELDSRFWIVEGAGGLLVPLTDIETTRDLVSQLKLELLIVARTQLGTINHTLLTIEAARHKNIPIAGIVLVGREDPGLSQILLQYGQIPVIAEIPWFENTSFHPSEVAQIGQRYFPEKVLRSLL